MSTCIAGVFSLILHKNARQHGERCLAFIRLNDKSEPIIIDNVMSLFLNIYNIRTYFIYILLFFDQSYYTVKGTFYSFFYSSFSQTGAAGKSLHVWYQEGSKTTAPAFYLIYCLIINPSCHSFSMYRSSVRYPVTVFSNQIY